MDSATRILIIGAVFGILAAVLFLAVVAYMLYYFKKKKQTNNITEMPRPVTQFRKRVKPVGASTFTKKMGATQTTVIKMEGILDSRGSQDCVTSLDNHQNRGGTTPDMFKNSPVILDKFHSENEPFSTTVQSVDIISEEIFLSALEVNSFDSMKDDSKVDIPLVTNDDSRTGSSSQMLSTSNNSQRCHQQVTCHTYFDSSFSNLENMEENNIVVENDKLNSSSEKEADVFYVMKDGRKKIGDNVLLTETLEEKKYESDDNVAVHSPSSLQSEQLRTEQLTRTNNVDNISMENLILEDREPCLLSETPSPILEERVMSSPREVNFTKNDEETINTFPLLDDFDDMKTLIEGESISPVPVETIDADQPESYFIHDPEAFVDPRPDDLMEDMLVIDNVAMEEVSQPTLDNLVTLESSVLDSIVDNNVDNNLTDEVPSVHIVPDEVHIVLDEVPSVQIVPDEVPIVQIVPDEVTSVHIVPDEVPSVHIVPDEVPIVQIVPDEVPIVQIVPDEVLNVQIVPDEVPSVQIVPDEVPSVQIVPDANEDIAVSHVQVDKLDKACSPNANLSAISIPAYDNLSGISMPYENVSAISMPYDNLSTISMPDVNLSAMSMPGLDANLNTVNRPAVPNVWVDMSHMTCSQNANLSAYSVNDVNLSGISMPNVNLSAMSMPDLDANSNLDTIKIPDVNVIPVTSTTISLSISSQAKPVPRASKAGAAKLGAAAAKSSTKQLTSVSKTATSTTKPTLPAHRNTTISTTTATTSRPATASSIPAPPSFRPPTAGSRPATSTSRITKTSKPASTSRPTTSLPRSSDSTSKPASASRPTTSLPRYADSTSKPASSSRPTTGLPRSADRTSKPASSSWPTTGLPRSADRTSKPASTSRPTTSLPRSADRISKPASTSRPTASLPRSVDRTSKPTSASRPKTGLPRSADRTSRPTTSLPRSAHSTSRTASRSASRIATASRSAGTSKVSPIERPTCLYKPPTNSVKAPFHRSAPRAGVTNQVQ